MLKNWRKIGIATKYTDTEAAAAAKAVKLDDFTAPDDTTDLDAAAAKHGLMPKADWSKLDGVASGADVTADNAPQAHAVDKHTDMQIVRKTADETITESTTLQDDDELLFPVAANEVWELELSLRITAGTTPDLKFAFAVPTGATIIWTGYYGAHVDEENNATAALLVATNNLVERMLLKLLYTGGANAGNVQLQWAQNTSSAAGTKVLANSYIIAHRLGVAA